MRKKFKINIGKRIKNIVKCDVRYIDIHYIRQIAINRDRALKCQIRASNRSFIDEWTVIW